MVQGKCALRRRHALFLASLTALAGSHALAASTTYNYTGAAGDGNYFTPANWTPAGPPTTTNSDIGNISAGTFVVTANGTIGANGTTSPTIFLGNGTYNDTLLYNSFYGGNGALENAVVGNAVTNINPYVSSVSSYLYEANTAVGTGIEIASGSVINVASPASDDSLTVDSVTVKTGGILENTGVGIMRLAGLITNNGLVQTTGSAVISLENGGSMTSSGGVVGQFNVGAGTSVLITGAGSANTYTLNTIATTNNGTIDLNAFNFLVGNSRPKQLIVNGGSFTNNGTFNLRLTRPYFDFTGQSDTATASIGATTGGVATTFTNTGTLNVNNAVQEFNQLGQGDQVHLAIGSLVNGWTNSGTVNVTNTGNNLFYTSTPAAIGTNTPRTAITALALLSSYYGINNSGAFNVNGFNTGVELVNTLAGTFAPYNQSAGSTTLQNGGFLMTGGTDASAIGGTSAGNALGVVNVNGGSLTIGSGSALFTPVLTIGSGALVNVQSGGAFGISSNSGNHDYYQSLNTQVNVSNGGTLNLSSGSIINNVFTLSGVTYGGISLVVDGTVNAAYNSASPNLNLLALASLGTTGQLNLNGQGLTVTGADASSIVNGSSGTIYGPFSGAITNMTSLSVTGGTLTFGSAISNSGPTTITGGGTLALNNSTGQYASTALTLGGGNLAVATNAPTFASGGTTLNFGPSTISASGITNTLALGAITRNVGATIDFGTLPTAGSITTTTANANPTGGQQTIVGGYATVGGTTWAVSGSGATAGAISGLSSYSSTFIAAADVDAGASVTPGTLTINSLRFNSGPVTISDSGANDTLTVATGGILQTAASGAVTFNQGFLTSNSSYLVLNQNNPSSNMTINSVVQGNISLTKTGAGITTLTAANTYTGATTVGAGLLEVSGSLSSSTINIANNATLQVDSGASLPATSDVTLAGAVYLHGQGGSDVAVGGARLNLSNASQTIHTLNGSGVVNFGLDPNSFVATTALTITDGGSFSGIFADATASGGSDTLTIGHSDGSTAPPFILTNNNQGGAGGNSAELFTPVSLTVNAGATLQVGTGGVAGQLLVLNGTSTHLVINGTLAFDTSDLLGTTVNGFIAGTVHNNIGLQLSGSGTVLQMGTGLTELLNAGLFGGNFNIAAGTLEFGTSTSGTVTANIADGATLESIGTNGFSGIISGSGRYIENAGSATTVFTGANTYTGSTLVLGGTLQLGDGSTATPGGGLTSAGFLSATTPITLGSFGNGGSADGFLQSDPASGQTITIPNTIVGNGGVKNVGPGTTILTGANGYQSAVISAGTLQVGNGGTNNSLPNASTQGGAALGFTPGAINFSGAGTLVLDMNTTAAPLVVANAITQTTLYGSPTTGSVSDIGTGTLILTGANTYTGTTTISSGTIQVGNLSTTGTLGQAVQGYAGSVVNNSALVFARTDTGLVVSNAISGTGTLSQIATGTTTLIGSNTYTGSTTVNAGSLVESFNLASAAASGAVTLSNDISPSSNLVLSGGKFTLQGASNGSATSLTTGANTTSFAATSPVITVTSTAGLAAGQTINATGAAAGLPTSDVVVSVISNTQFVVATLPGGANTSSEVIPVSGTPNYTSTQSFNATTVGAGSSPVTATLNGGVGVALNLGTITRNSGGNVDFTPPAGTLVSGTNGITTVNANTNGILGGWATYQASGWAVSAGTGSAAGLITGLTTYSPTYAAGANVDSAINTSSPSTVAINSLRFNTAGKYVVGTSAAGETLTITSGGILQTSTVGANVVTINSSNLTSGNGQDLILLQNDTSTGAAMQINSVITGNIGLTKGLAGTVILAGGNTYTGATTIGAGTLQLGNFGSSGSLGTGSGTITDNGVLAINRTDALSIANVISGYGAVSEIGTGATTLSAAESYLGATTITAGTLALASSANVNSLSALTLGGGTLSLAARTSSVTFSNIAAVSGQLPGTTSLSAGSSTVSVASLGAGNTLALNGITRAVGGVINFNLPSTGSITTADLNANTILGGYATVGGNTWAVSAASGATLGAISGLTNYSTTFAATSDVDAATGASTPGTLAINSLRFNNAGSYTVGANAGDALTISSGGILETASVGANAVTISSATLTSGNDQDLIFIQNNPSASLTVNSVINGLGSLTAAAGTPMALTKAGPGTVVLTGANTYVGANYIVGGTLSISSDGNLGAVPAAAGTDITLAGGTLGVTGSANFTLNANRRIVLNPGGGTVDVAGGQVVTIAGIISGASSFTKADTGTATLSAANTYTGNTTVTGGTLTFGVKSALPAGTNLSVGASALASATNLGTNSANALTVNSLVLAGATNAWTGTLDLNNNALIVHNTGPVTAAAALTQLTNQVAQGYNNGNWNGPGGILSTTAANDTTHLTALGVIQNDNGAGTLTALKTTLDSQAVSDTDILLKYTYYGDANLDGKVDASDYSRIDNAYLNNNSAGSTPLTGWFNGDFNYDGVINGSDYTLIDNAFNTQGATILAQVADPSATSSAQVAGGVSAVPEPTTLSLLGIGAVGLLGRRRRRN